MNQVVISGAGPNGLMLACELALAGVRPLVLERLTEAATEPKANGLVGQVVRMLHRRGLYDRLTDQPLAPTPGFVFGALPMPLADLGDHPLYLLGVPQRQVERVLGERAAELGVEVRRGHALTGLTQDDDGVTVEVNGRERIRTEYLVGADGGHSPTRRLAGIGFPGVTHDDSVSRTAHVTVPAEWVDATDTLTVPGYGRIPGFLHHRTDRGLFVFAPFPGRPALVSTIEWGASEPAAPPTIAELEASVRRVLGADVPLGPPAGDGPHLLRRLTSGNTRLADRYREGRVLLVGDAAHVHSAIGGPGLNLGLQDAVNLGWKLAAAVHRGAADLLDTYEGERRPVSERVIMSSLAQSALIAPGDEVTALRTLMTELFEEPTVRRRIADLMAGADVRYDTGCDHPLAGRFVPGTAQERRARAQLVDPTGALDPGSWEVDVVAGDGPAMLVRPDGYVAWASTEPDQEGLTRALSRWLGPQVCGVLS
ncbi:FAD-dependent monooxygenase [Pseudonocardia ailaonensis]|uniref:FAD-dependent monooxygenase n=1 Tax=Pseudonocardia ailaonensis TaxID=367279 RepID=A0ABN2NHQ4_9PSEU